MHLSDGYWEIIGLVKDDKSLKALTAIELGPELGMYPYSPFPSPVPASSPTRTSTSLDRLCSDRDCAEECEL